MLKPVSNDDSKGLGNTEGTEGIYLGGLLKFRTKLIPIMVIAAVVYVPMGFVALYVVLSEMATLRLTILPTLIFHIILHYGAGVGNTMGAHRLWSHNAFKANLPVRIVLMMFQTYSGLLSIHKWALTHKLHHKYTDTNGDPYSAERGLIFSHIGWLLMKPHPEVLAKVKVADVSYLEKDGVVMFQRKYYKLLFFFLGILLPVMIPVWLWGESIYFAAMISFLNQSIVSHEVASINSLAHYKGSKPYDKNMYATQNNIVAVLIHGEGWHNFHHSFPSDYRASEHPYNNFTATVIDFCARRGWVYDLKTATPEMIERKALRSGDGSRKVASKTTNYSFCE